MQNLVEEVEILYSGYISKRYTNIRILNDLDIPHGFGFADGIYQDNKEKVSDQFSPTDNFTKFLIYGKLLEYDNEPPTNDESNDKNRNF